MAGELTKIALAVMFSSFLIGVLAGAIQRDLGMQKFHAYQKNQNLSKLNGNSTAYIDGDNPVNNMQAIAENINQAFANAQKTSQNKDPITQLAIGFGLAATVSLQVLNLIIGVLIDGGNFILGISMNLAQLPNTLYKFKILGPFVLAIFTVYVIFRILSAHEKWEI